MFHKQLSTAVACLALAACNSEPSENDERTATTPAGAVPSPSGFASTYTDFALDSCEVLSENREEGSSASYRCPGFGDVALLVQEGDGRFDIDAGTDDDGFQTIGAFNDIGDTVEWRLEGNRPVAVIFRYLDATMEAEGRTVLAVETVGIGGAPGCRVAQIAGDTPDANIRARELADTAADPTFVCPATPQIVGDAR